MDDDDRPERARQATVGEHFVRLVGIVLLAILGAWLALRVISGLIRTVVWLVTTALIIVAVFFIASYLLGRRGERKGYF